LRALIGLAVQVSHENHERFERCRQLFEDYCVITESVRQGIPVAVAVSII
jgi:organic hydroperoxide reductase OsmC/OhrA